MQRVMIFPKVTLDQPNRAATVLEGSAGKAVNVARVLHLLGEKCLVSGFLGGQSGQFIARDLDASGIEHQFVEVASATRLCITMIDQSTSIATELVEDPAPVDPSAWESLRSIIRDLLPRSSLLVLSGSLPPQAPQDFYAECMQAANAAGIQTILDARGEPLKRALPHKPFVVKPNRAELGETVGATLDSDRSLRDAVRQLISAGPVWAVITLGADGCLISNGVSFWRLTVPRVKPISAVGSGDAFTAGLAASIARGIELPQAALLAAACGVSNALNPLPGQIKSNEVQRFQEQMKLTAE